MLHTGVCCTVLLISWPNLFISRVRLKFRESESGEPVRWGCATIHCKKIIQIVVNYLWSREAFSLRHEFQILDDYRLDKLSMVIEILA